MLLFFALIGCASHQLAQDLTQGGTMRLTFLLAATAGPHDEDAIRTAFVAGLNTAQLANEGSVRVITDARADADVVLEARLGPAAIWESGGGQIIDVPVTLRVLDEKGRTLSRMTVPCSAAGYFARGLDTRPAPAPPEIARRHEVPVGALLEPKPIWSDENGPFMTLAPTCGARLLDVVNGR